MKNFIKIMLLGILFISGGAFSQTTTKTSGTKRLYTANEKAQIKNNFFKNIKTLKMTPEVEKKYLGVVNKYSQKMNEANRNKDLTNEQYERAITSLVREQNSNLKKLLTYDQYKKHLIIFNPIENSVKYRISQR